MKKALGAMAVALLVGAAVYTVRAGEAPSPPAAQRWQAVTGTVQAAPTGQTFTILSQRDGRFTVDATGALTRRLGRTVNFDEVQAGRVVTAYGERTDDRIRAAEVCICPTMPEPGRVAGFRTTNLAITGTVTAREGQQVSVLSRRDGAFTVDTSAATFRQYGSPASVDAIQEGLVIRAWGDTTGTARTIRAQEVCICPGSLPADSGTTDAEAGK